MGPFSGKRDLGLKTQFDQVATIFPSFFILRSETRIKQSLNSAGSHNQNNLLRSIQVKTLA